MQEHLFISLVLEIQYQRALVTVEGGKHGRHTIAPVTHEASQVTGHWRFDFYNIGTLVAKNHARDGPGDRGC